MIDEIIGGGDGLAYKVRKADKKPSAISKLFKKIRKMLGMGEKKKKEQDPNAPPPPPLTKEQQEMADMDKYYTTFNWELPDQKPMVLPPKPKKEKKKSQEDGKEKTGGKGNEESNAISGAYTFSPEPLSLVSADPISDDRVREVGSPVILEKEASSPANSSPIEKGPVLQ